MSLATRCIACSTVFRVVQDQLRVSGGWVRCGRCGEVFNAVESLVDLEVGRAVHSDGESAHKARVIDELVRVSGAGPEPDEASAQDTPATIDDGSGSGGATGQASDLDASAAGAGARGPVEVARASGLTPGNASSPSTAATRADELPGFVRRADRAARWRRPGVRAVLLLGAVAAAGLLAWQVVLAYHDRLAANWPSLAGPIAAICARSGCTVGPWRRIGALTVESSTLARGDSPGQFRLSLVLRNSAGVALRLPAAELALTDAQGRLLVRRVLLPAQLGAPASAIAAGSEVSLAATLRTSDPAVVGYTIEIFYP